MLGNFAPNQNVSVAGQVVSVGGSLLILGTASVDSAGNHPIYRLGSDGKLSDTGVAGVALGAIDGTVWSVDASQDVNSWDATNNRWAPAPKGISSGGSTFFLGTAATDSGGDHKNYRFDANGQLTWTNAMAKVLGTADGTAWALNAANSVSYWNATNSTWVTAPRQVIFGSNVFFLGAAADSAGDYTIYSFGASGQLSSTNGQGVDLGIAEGTLWSANAANNVFSYDATSSAWTPIQPNAVAADGNIFFLGTAAVDSSGDRGVYRFDANGQLSNTNGIAIDLGVAKGTVWTANAFHDVHYWYTGIYNVWLSAVSSVVGPDGSVFFLGANSTDSYGNFEVYRFGPDGTLSDTSGSGMSLRVQSGNVLLVSDYFTSDPFGYGTVTSYWGPNGTWVPTSGTYISPVQGTVYYNYNSGNAIDVASKSNAWFPWGGTSTVSGGLNVGSGGSAVIQGNVTAPVTVNGGTIDVAVTATLTLPGTSGPGTLSIQTGDGILDGTVNGSVAVSGGASVQGSGNVSGNLAAQINTESPGTLAILLPGDSPGLLTVGGLSLNSASEIQEKIYGPLADSTYSQIKVNGDVSLGGATLKLDLGGYQPNVGQQFLIIDNQGANPINGTFNNLPEGGYLTVGNTRFQISYKGGNGKDVTLTVVAQIEPAPVPSPSPAPVPSPSPTPPTLQTPPLLAFIDSLLEAVETVNGNGTETVIDSLFGIPLLVSTYNGAGDLASVTLFGIDITFLFE